MPQLPALTMRPDSAKSEGYCIQAARTAFWRRTGFEPFPTAPRALPNQGGPTVPAYRLVRDIMGMNVTLLRAW